MFLESMILHNFRCFSDIEIKFNNRLTVVVGNNGAGKSTILEAATIAAGTLTAAMDGLTNYGIKKSDAHYKYYDLGSTIDVQPQFPVEITASGKMDGKDITWSRSLKSAKGRGGLASAKELTSIAEEYQERMRNGDRELKLPVISYYGTGLIVGTTVFFEAGVVILIPLAFGLAKKTKKSTLYYVIPLLAGLATGFAFIPPSAGSVLVANMLGVDLGIMIAVGVPTGILSLIFAGILWSKFIGTKIHTDLPISVSEIGEEEEAKLPKFSTVILIILVPLILILCSTLSEYIPSLETIRPVLQFVGTPFVALIIAILCAMYFLGKKQGYDGEQLKKIMDRSLRPTGQILLVITGGGIIRWVLQECGMGDIIGPALEQSGLPLILAAFLIAALVRASVGAAVVAMTMAAGIMASMPEIANLSPLYLAAMVCAITGGATAFSHVNDSGFWLVSSLLEIDEKTTLKSWTMMETIIGFTGLICAFVISLFA